MSAEKFIDLLKDFRGVLNNQQIKTLRGQALAGDISGALKGLDKSLNYILQKGFL